MITTALPEEALNELLELTGATRIEMRPGDVLSDMRSYDDDADDDDEDDEGDDDE